jgi:gas vesicle protein
MASQIEGFLKGVVLGGVIGAAIAILYAPQSGRKTREDINRKTEKLLRKAKEEYRAMLKKSDKTYEAVMKDLKKMESLTKDKVEEMREKVDEWTELGKETLQDTQGRLTKALNAAVHTFQ